MPLPKLPPRAAYILSRVEPRNANEYNLERLQGVKDQLVKALTVPSSGQLRLLPQFRPSLIDDLESAAQLKSESPHWNDYGWLVDADEWRKEREGMASVLVLRDEKPETTDDNSEDIEMNSEDIKPFYTLLAEVTALIRRSPALTVLPLFGRNTRTKFQLALAADRTFVTSSPIIPAFGSNFGLSDTSLVASLSRQLSPGEAYRLLNNPFRRNMNMTNRLFSPFGESQSPEKNLDKTVNHMVGMPPQPQALGKWAFWTQLAIRGPQDIGLQGSHLFAGDGYEEAAIWAARMMGIQATSADAKEGLRARNEGRRPQKKTDYTVEDDSQRPQKKTDVTVEDDSQT